MNIVRRVIDILIERAVPIVAALFASRLETIAALEQAESQNELEERARQLEDEGKPQLAAVLRQQAARIDPENPGSNGLCVIRRLEQDGAEHAVPLLENAQDTDQTPPETRPATGQTQRRRTTTRRSRNSKVDE